mmetsp:Transcript_18871/g.53771  ORF Transcript_18871/g.53771 Transcript_18871/m.53771 type:complete len:271 (-) Transcript_18871:147-959(-)
MVPMAVRQENGARRERRHGQARVETDAQLGHEVRRRVRRSADAHNREPVALDGPQRMIIARHADVPLLGLICRGSGGGRLRGRQELQRARECPERLRERLGVRRRTHLVKEARELGQRHAAVLVTVGEEVQFRRDALDGSAHVIFKYSFRMLLRELRGAALAVRELGDDAVRESREQRLGLVARQPAVPRHVEAVQRRDDGGSPRRLVREEAIRRGIVAGEQRERHVGQRPYGSLDWGRLHRGGVAPRCWSWGRRSPRYQAAAGAEEHDE